MLSTGLKPLRRPAAVRKVQEPAATPPWLELPNAAHLSDGSTTGPLERQLSAGNLAAGRLHADLRRPAPDGPRPQRRGAPRGSRARDSGTRSPHPTLSPEASALPLLACAP